MIPAFDDPTRQAAFHAMKFDLSEVLGYVCYKIANAQVLSYPFPHFYVEEVFPPAFYRYIRDNLPLPENYNQGASHYNGRIFADPTSSTAFNFLLDGELLQSVVDVFKPAFLRRYPTAKFQPRQDLRLILDSKNYAIGPHTDAPWKIVSLLFYLPEDYTLESLGTSIYTPKNAAFRCPGGPHHKFEAFTKIFTAPFRPNSCFGFFKTSNSFHGVDPITVECRRDVLLWNLYDSSAE